MRELSFAEVRAAGLPARVEFAFIGYRYRPLLDDVIVCVPPDREACATTLYGHVRQGGVRRSSLLLA